MTFDGHRRELNALTSIRFVAALIVFFFHVHIRWPLDGPRFLVNIISQGAVGMSLFFILSGFILTYNYYGGLPSTEYSQYFVRRFSRIYPVYFVAALFALPWLIPIPPVNQTVLPEPVVSVVQFVFIVGADLSLTQAWFPALFHYWNNGLTWSLSVEAFCYLLFPFMLPMLSQLNRKNLFVVLGIAIMLSVSPGLAWYLFDPKPSPALAVIYALPINRLPEFIVGMIFGVLFIQRTPMMTAIPLSTKVFSAGALVTAYLGLVGGAFPLFVTHNFVIVPLFALIIYWCAHVEGGPLHFLLGNRLLRFLGESSYSFYLMQFFPLVLVKQHYDIISTYAPPLRNSWILAITLLLVTIILAAASYQIIELPARRYIRLKYQSQRKNSGASPVSS
jgi:peptidoglycan/LPS O-acetylase OafA/YrhL